MWRAGSSIPTGRTTSRRSAGCWWAWARTAAGTCPTVFVTEFGIATDNGRCLDDNYGWPKCLTYQQTAALLRGAIADMRSTFGRRLAEVLIFWQVDGRPSGSTADREGVLRHRAAAGPAQGRAHRRGSGDPEHLPRLAPAPGCKASTWWRGQRPLLADPRHADAAHVAVDRRRGSHDRAEDRGVALTGSVGLLADARVGVREPRGRVVLALVMSAGRRARPMRTTPTATRRRSTSRRGGGRADRCRGPGHRRVCVNRLIQPHGRATRASALGRQVAVAAPINFAVARSSRPPGGPT